MPGQSKDLDPTWMDPTLDRDPVMEDLYDTIRQEQQANVDRAERELRQAEEALEAARYTLADLINDLQRLGAKPDMDVEAEGCDCIRSVRGVVLEGTTIMLETS